MSSEGCLQIYVACLAAYNAGTLHGEWIDATQDEDVIAEEIQAMLAASPIPNAEEYAIHDYEGFGEVSTTLGEYPNLSDVVEAALFIQEYEEIAIKLISYCGDIEEAKTALNEQYQGCYSSLADYAETYASDTGAEIPNWLEYYIDWEKMGRDYEISGDVFTLETAYDEIHVFLNY